MNAAQMRLEIGKVYGPAMRKKLNAMPDRQVVAIYRRLQNEGKF